MLKGQKNSPEDVHVLTPRTCKYASLYSNRALQKCFKAN